MNSEYKADQIQYMRICIQKNNNKMTYLGGGDPTGAWLRISFNQSYTITFGRVYHYSGGTNIENVKLTFADSSSQEVSYAIELVKLDFIFKAKASYVKRF